MKPLFKIFTALFVVGVALVFLRMVMLEVEAKRVNALLPVKSQCTRLLDAVQFYSDTLHLDPPKTNGLGFLLNVEECRKMLINTNLNDPWGTPYRLRFEGNFPAIDSAGPDRKFDTSDDIHSF